MGIGTSDECKRLEKESNEKGAVFWTKKFIRSGNDWKLRPFGIIENVPMAGYNPFFFDGVINRWWAPTERQLPTTIARHRVIVYYLSESELCFELEYNVVDK